MYMFRSKTKRRFSYDLNIHKQINFHPDKMNFHAMSYFLLVMITCLSNRYGKWILLAYFLTFIVKTLISYYTKIRNWFYNEVNNLKEKIIYQLELRKEAVNRLMIQIDIVEGHYFKMNSISATLSQIVFFTLCEKLLLPNQNGTALYSLMFYNVLSYFISYMDKMLSNTHWSPYVNIATHSNIMHLAMSATKIVLEVTKAVTFFMSVIFMLFVLCLEQKMQYYQPTKWFTLLTFAYYSVTENAFASFFPFILSHLQIRSLENLETLWAPVLLSVASQCLSLCLASVLLLQGTYNFTAFIALYLNVYLTYKKLSRGSLKILNEEKKLVLQFRYATKSELQEFEDVCAVCLNEMKIARITPCHHIFHTDCLRKCLLSCNTCPVCKRELEFS